jgi:hypothetical protein
MIINLSHIVLKFGSQLQLRLQYNHVVTTIVLKFMMLRLSSIQYFLLDASQFEKLKGDLGICLFELSLTLKAY